MVHTQFTPVHIQYGAHSTRVLDLQEFCMRLVTVSSVYVQYTRQETVIASILLSLTWLWQPSMFSLCSLVANRSRFGKCVFVMVIVYWGRGKRSRDPAVYQHIHHTRPTSAEGNISEKTVLPKQWKKCIHYMGTAFCEMSWFSINWWWTITITYCNSDPTYKPVPLAVLESETLCIESYCIGLWYCKNLPAINTLICYFQKWGRKGGIR